jgi:hypothetical protein
LDNHRNDRQFYTYADAGFNPFLRRSIDSGQSATLGGSSSDFRRVNNQQINFDSQQVTGSLGDKIQVGDIVIDGGNRRISIYDDGRANEVGRIGNLDG